MRLGLFERSEGHLYVRRIRKSGQLGRPRGRFVFVDAHDCVNWKRVKSKRGSSKRDIGALSLEFIEDVVKGIPGDVLEDEEQDKVKEIDGLFTLLHKSKHESIVLEAASSQDATLWIQGLRQIIRQYKDLHSSMERLSLQRHAIDDRRTETDTSHDRIMQVWARFFENCAKFSQSRHARLCVAVSAKRKKKKKKKEAGEADDAAASDGDCIAAYGGEYGTDTAASEVHEHDNRYSEYELCVDDEGNMFYYNKRTQISTWELVPPLGDCNEDWGRFVDDETGRAYWYDAVSGESVWEQDESALNENEEATESRDSAANEDEAWEREEEMTSYEIEDATVSHVSATDKDAEAWERLMDPESGEAYWYDAVSGESVWESYEYDEQNDTTAAVETAKDVESDKDTERDDTWVYCIDPESGHAYWYDSLSGESIWEEESGGYAQD